MLVAYTVCKKIWTSSWTDVKESQIRDQFFEAAFRKDDHVDDVTVGPLSFCDSPVSTQGFGATVDGSRFNPAMNHHLGWC